MSPEIGMSVSFSFVARLLGRVGRRIKNKHPEHFVRVQIQLSRSDRQYDAEQIERSVMQCYEEGRNFGLPDFQITVKLEPLDDFMARFSQDIRQADAIDRIFSAERSRFGDYGYFVRFDDELVFLNLVPARENRQIKNVMKLISNACERQFSKTHPGYLWLHLQALDAGRFKDSPSEMLPVFERLARYAFQNDRRAHISSLIFSCDTVLEPKRYLIGRKSARGMESTGYVKGFDNPRGKFPNIPAFAPLLQTITRHSA